MAARKTSIKEQIEAKDNKGLIRTSISTATNALGLVNDTITIARVAIVAIQNEIENEFK